jgi:hypothetical protein
MAIAYDERCSNQRTASGGTQQNVLQVKFSEYIISNVEKDFRKGKMESAKCKI